MHRSGCYGAGCAPSCTANRLAPSKEGQRKKQRWHALLKSRAAPRPALLLGDETRPSLIERIEIVFPSDGRASHRRQESKEVKKSAQRQNSLCMGRRKKGGAPREKTSAQKPGEPRRVRERTGDHCKITCTVKPISRSNHTDRGAPCLPSPRGPRKVVRYVASMPPCLARAMQPEQVDHADFVETEPTESWSETVAALTFAAWAWLSRAPQAARCYS